MTDKKAILFKLGKEVDKDGIANLELIELNPENGSKFTLSELQKHVEGYIESGGTISIDNSYYQIFVDEEGLIKNKPTNFGFWWAFGTKEGKYKFVGNVLCVKEEALE